MQIHSVGIDLLATPLQTSVGRFKPSWWYGKVGARSAQPAVTNGPQRPTSFKRTDTRATHSGQENYSPPQG
jgi:hypothetical protein